MKTKKALILWLVNLFLWGGFIAAFFLDLTGLDVHQWLGVCLAALAGYHLILHWKWVKAVNERFFSSTSRQARTYYLLDVAILTGFSLIAITGVVISSWLSLTLTAYSVWYDVHVIGSILTLLLVVGKLGLHWRVIVQAAHKYVIDPLSAPKTSPVPTPVTAMPNRITRRSFLTLMGVVGAAAGAAVIHVNASAPTNTSSSTTAQAVNTTTSNTTSSACVMRCNKGCSYPGRCRRYTDSNGNGKCDLGECL